MKKFLFLARESLKQIDQKTQAEFDNDLGEMSRWVAALAESGNFANGEALLTYGRYVTKDSVLSDGPFIEAKEAVSGIITIHAENLEQATSIAQNCPLVLKGVIAIEVRPIMIVDNTNAQ